MTISGVTRAVSIAQARLQLQALMLRDQTNADVAAAVADLRALLLASGMPVVAADYGAVGDGVSRPLSTIFATLAAAQAAYPNAVALTDELDGTAIQAAMNASRRVYVPTGTYLVNVTLDPSNPNQWILGDGINAAGGSVIKWNGATGSTIMKAPGGASRLDGIKIDGNNVGTVSGIVSDDTHQPGRADWGTVDIVNCPTVGFDLSVTGAASGIYYNNFGAMRVQSCGTGVRLRTSTGVTAKVNANSWKHLLAISNAIGLQFNLADGNAFLFADCENNSSMGIDVLKGDNNVIWGGWLEANTTWHIRIAATPDVLRFAYWGQASTDSKMSFANDSTSRSLMLPIGNSHNWGMRGRWFSDEIQMQAVDANGAPTGNLLDIVPNSLGFNRSSSAGMSFIDQKNQTANTGLALRVSIASAGDTAVQAVDNGAAGGRIGFFDKAVSGVLAAQPTGYGTPTNIAKLINFPGTAATLAQTGGALADLINQLKAMGILGA